MSKQDLRDIQEEAEAVQHDIENTVKNTLHEPTEQTGREPFGLRLVALIIVMIIATIILAWQFFYSVSESDEIDDGITTPSVIPNATGIPEEEDQDGDSTQDETSFVPRDTALQYRLSGWEFSGFAL